MSYCIGIFLMSLAALQLHHGDSCASVGQDRSPSATPTLDGASSDTNGGQQPKAQERLHLQAVGDLQRQLQRYRKVRAWSACIGRLTKLPLGSLAVSFKQTLQS